MALEYVMGFVASLMALTWSTLERTVENAAVRWSRVLVSIIFAYPMGMATNSTIPR